LIIALFVRDVTKKDNVSFFVTKGMFVAKTPKEKLTAVVTLVPFVAVGGVAKAVKFAQMANACLANKAILVWFATKT